MMIMMKMMIVIIMMMIMIRHYKYLKIHCPLYSPCCPSPLLSLPHGPRHLPSLLPHLDHHEPQSRAAEGRILTKLTELLYIDMRLAF